jgi:hypothetical protein
MHPILATLSAFAVGLASLALVACDTSDALEPDEGTATRTGTTRPAESVLPGVETAAPSDGTATGGGEPGSAGGWAPYPGAGGSVEPAPATGGPDSPVSSTPTTDLPKGPSTPPPSTTPQDPGYRTQIVPAPIDNVDILVRESYPPQYAAVVTSGLPSGCAHFHSISMERDGTTFEITVLNQMPADGEQVACTMIYGMVENTVELGSDLVPGTTYTVVVNGEVQETFTAQ